MRDDVDSTVDRMAGALGRSVLVADRAQRLISYSASEDDADPVRIRTILDKASPPAMKRFLTELGIDKVHGLARAPANRELRSVARVGVPVSLGDRFYGYIWLLDPRSDLQEDDLDLVQTNSRLIANVLFRDEQLRDGARELERQLLEALLSPDDAVRTSGQAQVSEHTTFDVETYVRAVVIADRGRSEGLSERRRVELDEAVGSARWLWPPRRLLALTRSDHCVLLLACGRHDDVQVREFVARLRVELGRHPVLNTCAVGVGSLASLADALRTYDEAERSARVARAIPKFDQVAEWDNLGGVYRILSALHPDSAGLDPMVERLIEGDPDGSLVHTMETVFDLRGDVRAASEQLNLHRTSLYYRLHKVEDILGTSLKDGDSWLSLQMGLKLARMHGHLSSHTPSSSDEDVPR